MFSRRNGVRQPIGECAICTMMWLWVLQSRVSYQGLFSHRLSDPEWSRRVGIGAVGGRRALRTQGRQLLVAKDSMTSAGYADRSTSMVLCSEETQNSWSASEYPA